MNTNRKQYPVRTGLRDYGSYPLVVNMEHCAEKNSNYRTALWTGKHLQVTLMSIPVGGDIGLEIHPYLDQFIRIESGHGLVKTGPAKTNLCDRWTVDEQYAIVIPAGTWHNLINTGQTPIKLCSIYAPPQHPFGTVHRTKQDAGRAEK